MDDIRIARDFDSAVTGIEVTAAPDTPFGSLVISVNDTNLGNYDFEWASREGKFYDLVSATNLDTMPGTWVVWEGNGDIDGAAVTTQLLDVAGGGDPRRFFAVIEKDAAASSVDE